MQEIKSFRIKNTNISGGRPILSLLAHTTLFHNLVFDDVSTNEFLIAALKHIVVNAVHTGVNGFFPSCSTQLWYRNAFC